MKKTPIGIFGRRDMEERWEEGVRHVWRKRSMIHMGFPPSLQNSSQTNEQASVQDFVSNSSNIYTYARAMPDDVLRCIVHICKELG